MIRRLDEYTEWDKLVDNCPYGTIFHSSIWFNNITGLLGEKPVVYGYFKNNNLIGGYLLYERSFPLLKIALSKIATVPYGGIITDINIHNVRRAEKIYTDVINELSNYLNKKYDYIQIVNSPGIIDVRPFIYCGYNAEIYYTYYFNLNVDIWNHISKKVRNTIRKAEKHEIDIVNKFDSFIFYKLLEKTYRHQGMYPPIDKSSIIEILTLIKQHKLGEMWYTVTPNDDAISAEIFIWDDKRAYRWMASSDPEKRHTGSTSLLLYYILEYLKNDFNVANLMGANTPHLTKFISSFNPSLIPYYIVTKRNVKAKIAEKIWRAIR